MRISFPGNAISFALSSALPVRFSFLLLHPIFNSPGFGQDVVKGGIDVVIRFSFLLFFQKSVVGELVKVGSRGNSAYLQVPLDELYFCIGMEKEVVY
jgi:hypothetical protein